MTHTAYIRRETLVSMVINGVLSFAFFIAVFGRTSPVALWGLGHWVFDFIPQSFMIALMSTLVPGALAAKRLRAGMLQPSLAASRLPRSAVRRALLLTIAATVLGPAFVALAAQASGRAALDWPAALGLKVAYGILLGAVVTPVGLRGALARR